MLKHDVGQSFLKHEVMLNEIFLELVPQDGKTPAKVPRLPLDIGRIPRSTVQPIRHS